MKDVNCSWCSQEAAVGINETPGDGSESALDLCAEHCLALALDMLEAAAVHDMPTAPDVVEIEIG